MGFFNRKSNVIDLTEHFHKEQEKLQAMKEEAKESQPESSTSSAFGFLGNLASSVRPSNSENNNDAGDYMDMSSDASEKRKRLAKRIMDMTNKLEDVSNSIYHLQQRIEVLEKKSNLNDY